MDATFKNNPDYQSLTERFAQVLSARMSKADWHFDYSDDRRVWQKGSQEIGRITEDLRLLARLRDGLEAGKQLWQQHVPAHAVPLPAFFEQPKLLDQVFNGAIFKQDIPAVRDLLREFSSQGHRFVSMDLDALTLPKGRFVGFPSALQAEEHAYQHSNREKTFVTASIYYLRQEMDQATFPIISAEKRLYEMGQENKRPRGPELSR